MKPAVTAKPDEKKSHDTRSAAPVAAPVGPIGSFGATAGMPLFLQTKLIVDGPGDAYEREADDVASVATTRAGRNPWASPMRVSRISAVPAPSSAARVQRKCSSCDSGGPKCGHCAEEDDDHVQRKALAGGASYKRDTQWDLPPPNGDTHSESSALPPHVRDQIEPVLGADLGDVRVHTGPVAWRSTSALQARAFTHGRHIWLGQHESASDVALIAHESTHVVQQTGASPLHAPATLSSRDGAPLASPHASRLSTAYGRDVSGVRVHTDSPVPRQHGKDAVAVGDHVAFAPGAYQPGTRASDTLIAHEVAHVVQQRGGNTNAERGPPSPRGRAGHEHEAHRAAHIVTRGGTHRALSPAPAGKPQGGFISFVEDVGSGIADVASDVGGAVYDAGAYVVNKVEDWVIDRFWDIVREIYAPAEEYLRHPSKLWDLIIHNVMEGVSSLLGGVFRAFGAEGIFGPLGGLFKQLFAAAGELVGGLANGACGPLAAALNKAVNALMVITDAVLGPIKATFDAISSVVGKVVRFIGGGILDILKSIGGALWDGLSTVVNGIAKIFGKVRSAIGRVWGWVKDLLGFGSDDSSSGGIWEWIKDKASAAWEAVKSTVLGWVEPLKIVGGVLLALSPIGPLYIAFKYGPRIVHWIREIWKVVSDPQTLVAIKDYVAHTLLPGAMSFLLEVAGVFNGIAQGIAFALQLVSKPLADLAAAFDATKILGLIADAVRWFADLVNDAVTWVMEHIGPFFDAIVGFFKDLWSWLKPILDVLLKIIALANPVGIVMLLGSWIWLHIPDCIKQPIIRFILGFLIRVVDALPDVALFGPLWSLFKYGALGFLKRLQGTEQDPNEAEHALDRIARLVGGTADFVFGLVVGILEGLWDGLIGPFQLVYMLIGGVVGIIDFFEKLQNDFEEEVKAVVASAKGIGGTIEQEFWPTIKGLLSGEGGGGGNPMDTVLGLLKKVWDAVTGAATEVGTSIASALIGFIMLGDYELGSKLGYVGGLVLFEVVLAILTAGVSAELEVFESGIGWILKMLVKVNEAIGEAFGAILKVIPGVEGAIARLIETLGDLPILKNLGKEFSHMFGQVEELALAGLRRFGGEAAGEGGALAAKAATRGGGEAAKTLGTVDSRVAATDSKLATADAHAAAADAKVTSHADTPAARDAAVNDSERLESKALTDAQIDDELRHLGDHPEMVVGEPPARKAKLGNHTWEEQPNGGWCRHSNGERCVLKAPDGLKAPEGAGGSGGGGRPFGPRATAARQRVNEILNDFERRGINPRETLNFTEDEWQAFRRAMDEDPIAALQDLDEKIDIHGTRVQDIGGEPTEPDPFRKVPETPKNPFDLPEYQEAADSARRAMADLPEAPGVKTTAGTEGGRTQTLSGPKDSPAFPQSSEATDRAVVSGNEAGRAPDPHPFDGTARTRRGQTHGSHAEKQAAELAPGEPLGVSKVMCPDCQAWFTQRAVDRGEALVVADPDGVRIFMPDGSVHFEPHPSGMSGPRGNAPRGRQRKPIVNTPGDVYELEADAVAAAAASRNVDTPIAAAPSADAPLPSHVRWRVEPLLGTSLGDVRVHSGPAAAGSARALEARAFTHGRDIWLGAGESAHDVRLMAHESTHVVQQTGGRATAAVQRDPTATTTEKSSYNPPASPTLVDILANPPVTQYSVSTSGVTFHMTIRKLAVGSTDKQLMAIVLRALLGDNYTPKLIDPMLDVTTRAQSTKTGLWIGPQSTAAPKNDNSAPEEHVPDVFLDARIAVTILEGLKNVLKLHTTTTPDQEEVLLVGLFATIAWAELVQLHLGPGDGLPEWYTKFLFDRQAATHAEDFKAYGQGLDLGKGVQRGKDKAADDWRRDQLAIIAGKLSDEAEPVESIRLDASLCDISKTLKGKELNEAIQAAAMYRVLWNVPKDKVPTSPPQKANDAATIAAFLTWSFGQPTLAKRANDESDRDARVQLLVRFAVYVGFAQKSSTGDELLRAAPTAATALPFPSTMSAYPRLDAPLFQCPLDTERRFEHRLMFKNVYEAFSYYHFHWQVVPVKYSPKFDDDQPASTPTPAAPKPAPAPTTASGQAVQKPPSEWDEKQVGSQIDAQMKDMGGLSKMKGEAPSNMDRLRVRYARAVQYHKEDIQTVYRELGPAGVGAADLATLNAILRYAGAGLGVLFDTLFPNVTGTWSDKKIAFPEPGIYIVRCAGSPFVSGEETIVRAPSVAYQPVFVRPAEEIAAAAVYAAESRASDERAMKTDLDKLLKDDATETDPAKKLSDDDRKMLAGMQEDVVAADGGVKASLTLKLKRLEESISAHEKDQNSNAANLADEYTERDRLKELLHIQEKRGVAGAKPMHATFVSDGGDTMPLDMEESDKPNKDATWTATVSDLTSTKSGTDHADGKTRNDAIQNATKKTLESIHGYGRGMVAIEFDGKIISVRIAADVGQIGMEGIENLTTILTIAAIAAAPFTGGATLTLLLPIGAVGAIPSVYRLVERNRVGTLRWDLETAMDLVNIVGSVAGLAEFGMASRAAGLAAKGLRPGVWALRVGKGVLIINHSANAAGIVLLGGGIIAQLEALKGLPEGEARDRRLAIIGGALLQAGIMVGGSLAAEHAQAQQERLAAAREVVERTPHNVVADQNARTTAGAGEGGTPKRASEPPTSPGDKPKVDPLEHHLASGEKAPDVKLDPLHTDTTTIPDRFTWDEKIPDPARAMARYNEARARAPGREVAIWRNTKDGSYAVTVGTPHEVHPPSGSNWEGVLHFHPNPTNTTRFALPAPMDFNQLIARYHAADGKVAVREFVDSGMSGGRQTRTEFGIDPAHEFPFYVTQEVNGEKSTMRFKDDGTYRQEWHGQTVYVDEGTAKTMRAEVDTWLKKLREEHAKSDPAHPDIDVQPAAETSRTMAAAGDKPNRRIIKPEPKPVDVKPSEPATVTPPAARGPLTKDGSLTEDGLAWVRENVKGYEHKSNNEINADFYNHGTPHEAVLRAEKITEYSGRPVDDPNAYLITKGYRGRKEEPKMSGILREVRDVAKKAGHPLTGEEGIVNRSIDDLVGLIGSNEQSNSVSGSLQEDARAILADDDPMIRAEFQKFYFGEVDPALLTELSHAGRRPPKYLTESGKGWAHTKIGEIRPDVSELNLGANELKFTDFTQRYSDPVHNFKMKVYNEVARRGTGMSVSGIEYRNPRHQTPVK